MHVWFPPHQTQAPPPETKSAVDVSTVALPVADRVECLRNVCNQRLKFEVEYGLKRGTTDNTYVLLVRLLEQVFKSLQLVDHAVFHTG